MLKISVSQDFDTFSVVLSSAPMPSDFTPAIFLEIK
jgi:hypothetical protein